MPPTVFSKVRGDELALGYPSGCKGKFHRNVLRMFLSALPSNSRTCGNVARTVAMLADCLLVQQHT